MPSSSACAGRRRRSGPAGPGCRRRVRVRAPRHRAAGSPGPGPARRRRRWSRCRRCRRSSASPRRRSPPAAARRCLGSSRSGDRADRPGPAPAPKPSPSRSRPCGRRRAGRTSPRSARPAARGPWPRGTSRPSPRPAPSTVPSPPSAIGTRSIVASGAARTTPRAIASRGLRRRQASLELVRGNHHPHRCRARIDVMSRAHLGIRWAVAHTLCKSSPSEHNRSAGARPTVARRGALSIADSRLNSPHQAAPAS